MSFSPDGLEAISVIRDSKGLFLSVSDEEARAAQRKLASCEGVYAELSGAVAVVGVEKLISSRIRSMRRRLEEAGEGQIFLVITSGEGNYALVTKPPEDRPLREGDLVWMDAGCNVSGYWSDFSRAGVVGEASAEQKHAQEVIHRITMEAARMVRPGIRASSLARFCYAKLDQLDFPVTSTIGRLACRIGHGSA